MQSPYSFIVKPLKNRRYDNIKKYGDKDFVISVSQEDHTISNRYAKVVNVPMIFGSPLPEDLFKIDQRKIFALTIDIDALQRIRTNIA